MAASVFMKCSRTFKLKKHAHCFRRISFEALGINHVISQRLEKLGIIRPTEIQEKSIERVANGRNMIINAETGSGKTLCYLLPIVNNLINEPSRLDSPPYALIILPTVDLCHQVASVFKTIANPDMFPCIVSRDSNLHIKKSFPVVIAMPSALLNYNLDVLSNIRVIVTDEADFLTTSGGKDVWKLLNFFKHGKHLKKKPWHIYKRSRKSSAQTEERLNKSFYSNMNFPFQRQFLFVAATLPSRGKMASLNVLSKWLPQPEVVITSLVHQRLPTLDIEYVRVTDDTKLPELLKCLNRLAERKSKNEALCLKGQDSETLNGKNVEKQSDRNDRIISDNQERGLRVLVFTNTAHQATKVFQFLSNYDNLEANQQKSITFNKRDNAQALAGTALNDSKLYWKDKCAELHKDVPVEKRLYSLGRFKCGEINVLVCTDIASRGLDIPDVSHVIQLDFAPNSAYVLHRAGRTARAGAHGKVINFITPKDEDLAKALRACDDDPNANYDPTFSRNRMFRRRIKRNVLPLADFIEHTTY